MFILPFTGNNNSYKVIAEEIGTEKNQLGAITPTIIYCDDRKMIYFYLEKFGLV